MHCMIAWGTAEAGEALSVEEHKTFEEVLSGHAWIRVFAGAFIVNLIYDDELKELVDGLTDVAKKVSANRPTGSRVRVLVSPAIPSEAGLYMGWAAKSMWPELNKRLAI
jgi:hypothetical protein